MIVMRAAKLRQTRQRSVLQTRELQTGSFQGPKWEPCSLDAACFLWNLEPLEEMALAEPSLLAS